VSVRRLTVSRALVKCGHERPPSRWRLTRNAPQRVDSSGKFRYERGGNGTVRDTAGAQGGCITNESVTKFVPNDHHPKDACCKYVNCQVLA